jgi:hypothetical protein
MAERQSYPSPTAAQTRTGAGPFYGNGDVSPHPDAKDDAHEVPSHLQLAAEMENINPDLHGNGHEYVDEHQHIAAHSASEQLAQSALAQSVMSLANPYQPMPHSTQQSIQNAADAAEAAAAAAAAKARSKVSRACDECRRKKVSFSTQLGSLARYISGS